MQQGKHAFATNLNLTQNINHHRLGNSVSEFANRVARHNSPSDWHVRTVTGPGPARPETRRWPQASESESESRGSDSDRVYTKNLNFKLLAGRRTRPQNRDRDYDNLL